MSKLPGRILGFHFLGLSAGLLTFLFAIGPAFGAGPRSRGDRQSREKAEKAARKSCLTGDYTNGVSVLADLFIESKDPIYVFNQGRCLEQNSRYRDAIARFEEFLRISEDAADQAAARKHIDDCKAKLPVEDKPEVTAPPPLAQPVPQPMAQPLPQPEVAAQMVEKPKTEPKPPTNGRRFLIAGIVTGGVGVAGVIAGVAFNVKANSMVDEMENKVDAYTSSKNSSQQSYRTLAWVGYGVGAACIAAGTVLTVVGARRRVSSAQTDVALVPVVGPSHAGVLLRGGF